MIGCLKCWKEYTRNIWLHLIITRCYKMSIDLLVQLQLPVSHNTVYLDFLSAGLEGLPLGGILGGWLGLIGVRLLCDTDSTVLSISLPYSLSLQTGPNSYVWSFSSPSTSSFSSVWLTKSWDKDSSRVVSEEEKELERRRPRMVEDLIGGRDKVPNDEDWDWDAISTGVTGSGSSRSPATPFLGISTASRFILRLRPCSKGLCVQPIY